MPGAERSSEDGDREAADAAEGDGQRRHAPGGVDDEAASGGSAPTDERGARRWVNWLLALALTVVGVIASVVGGIPGLLLGPNTAAGFAVSLVGSELGYAFVGLGFVALTGRGPSYLDLELPGTRGWAVVGGFTLGAFVFRSAALAGSVALGVEPSGSTVTQVDLPLRTMVAILLPAFLLVVGPAEELLFRGVVQKLLREVASKWPAIVGAGLLFGVIHVFALVQSTGLGAVVAVTIITVVGVGLGWLYEHTGSLPAVMLAHGVYNSLILLSAYALQVA